LAVWASDSYVYILCLQYFARQHKIYAIYIEAIIFVYRDKLIDNFIIPKSNRK